LIEKLEQGYFGNPAYSFSPDRSAGVSFERYSPPPPVDPAARDFKVNPRYVSEAKAIQERAPMIWNSMSDGMSNFSEKKKGYGFLRNPLELLVAGVRFELTTFGL
jgi:hypothetical protein